MRQTRKRRMSKSRSQRAGKLLGLGGQGCVYAPPLRCLNAETPGGNVVSKLTTQRFAEVEKREYELLHTIDPEQNYTVYATFGCHPAEPTAAELAENPLNRCTPHIRYPMTDGRYLLFYPNGGQDLFEFQPPYDKVLPFFEGLQNVIRGLALLHQNNLVHMDLKPENIVTKWIPETQQFLTRIIDFGFAFRTSEAPPEFAGFWSRNYPLWPYELRFLYPDFQEDMITQESIEQYKKHSIAYQNHMYPSVRFEGLDAEFYKQVWQKIAPMAYPERVDFLTKSTDVFSLGRALSIVYAKTINHFCRGMQVYTTVDERYLNSFRKVDAKMLNEVSVPFYSNFVSSLMHPDPFKRTEVYEVGAMYSEFLANYRKKVQEMRNMY